MTPEIFLQIMLMFVGVPYKWQGNTPLGFDCSGLAEEALSIMGINPPGRQSADGLYRYFKQNGDQVPTAKAGDLAFFGTESLVEHVGIMISDTHMIEARGGDHLTLTVDDALAKNAFVGVRPLKHRPDLVAVLRPSSKPF